MREEFISFMNEGEKIVGTFHIPEKLPAPAVVFCHGFTGNRIGDHRIFVLIARELCSKGLAALRFDFRGSGESGGRFESKTVSGGISDLRAAIDFLSRREEVDRERIGVLGHSLGGVIILLTASGERRIKTICTWSTPADFFELIDSAKQIFGDFEALFREPFVDFSGDRIGKNFIADVLSYDLRTHVEKIVQPILIIHGTKDEFVPVSQAQLLFDLVKGPKELCLIEDADHAFNRWEWNQRIIERSVEWFLKHLK